LVAINSVGALLCSTHCSKAVNGLMLVFAILGPLVWREAAMTHALHHEILQLQIESGYYG